MQRTNFCNKPRCVYIQQHTKNKVLKRGRGKHSFTKVELSLPFPHLQISLKPNKAGNSASCPRTLSTQWNTARTDDSRKGRREGRQPEDQQLRGV